MHKQYSWKRDEDTGVAVLNWTEDGGRTWQRYYNPEPGKLYSGLGQMEKMRTLMSQGYVMVKDPKITPASHTSEVKDIGVHEYTLNTYGEEDPWAPIDNVLRSSEEERYNLKSFLSLEQKKEALKEELIKKSKEEVEDKAIEQVILNLQVVPIEDRLKFDMGAFRDRLRLALQADLIELVIKLYDQNVKARKLENILREVGI